MKFNKQTLAAAVAGLLLGALVILGTRFITYSPEKGVHYHANFAMYLNGQREEFKDIFYYIGAESCTGESEHATNPYARAHMHDMVGDVVHIEDEVVTWGQFFQNIGWIVDPKVIRTPDQSFLADSQNKLTFMLNGEQTDKVIRGVIGDKDRLLVDFGSTDLQTLQKEYDSIASTAEKYNGMKDSGSCGGAANEGNSWKDRMRHMF